MKKITLIILILALTGCASIKNNVGKIKPNIGECPPKEDRTLADFFCKEPK